MSAKRIKKKTRKWNESSATRAAASFLAEAPYMQEMLDKGEHLAKRCILCDGSPYQVGVYTPSIQEFFQWRVRAFVYALCSKCSEDPASKDRLLEGFERLAQLQNANSDRGLQ